MVTRDDVARMAGTSTAVVSYVVNNGPRRVSEKTRAKVLAAIDELGYRPNGFARALRSTRSRLLGLVLPDNSNPFFAELARVIEDEAFRRGYLLLLGNSTENDERQAAYVREFLELRVEGLLLISAAHGQRRCRPDAEPGGAAGRPDPDRGAGPLHLPACTRPTSRWTTSAAVTWPPATCWSTATAT